MHDLTQGLSEGQSTTTRAEFETETPQAEFIEAIEEASERKECRINQKKTVESLITTALQVQLETAAQWDRWAIELESNLKMIIGAK